MTGRETSEEIDRAAADWAARLDGAPLSPAEEALLETWSAADPRRLGALARAMAVLAHFDRARALGVQVGSRDRRPWEHRPVPRRPAMAIGRRELMFGSGLAASLAATAVILPGWLRHAREFSTRMGEVRSLPLADGSVIWLNTDSKVRVDYTASRRAVALLKGEALFDVAKDPTRPFVVRADRLDARAVGTSYSVSRLAGGQVKVVVSEGVVEVGLAADPARSRLAAGASAVAGSSGPVEVVHIGTEAATRSLSWRKGLLDFDGVSLAQAAAAFARYSDQAIVIDDPATARRTVTGLFSSTNPAGFAQAVALSMGLTIRAEPGAIHISR